MKRHFPQHYVINYAMPPILISLFLDLVSFLPPLSQQRIPLVIATVLALLFYMRSVDNRGPPSEVSLLGWFIFATVAEGLIVTFFSVWSIRIQYNYSLWRFFNNSRLYLGNLFCTLKTKAKNLLRRRRGNSLETIAILPINQASTNNVNPPTTTPGSANESYTQPDTTERREAILGDETENVNSENFDHIVAFAVIILKIVMVLIFVHLFKTVENDPLEYVQCTDEYYHE
ncbi:hypothetical protein HOLleu_37162 [Holothuria leucospilota]|uniref:Uncharacterized protein n=1 Tax=Holothuria leucospilota TaxID=206669 RepID=A0A9Q0YJ32_HOLLE|nr:hypothetical protein HOLleu_37162 [Holothuria leucospilota]